MTDKQLKILKVVSRRRDLTTNEIGERMYPGRPKHHQGPAVYDGLRRLERERLVKAVDCRVGHRRLIWHITLAGVAYLAGQAVKRRSNAR